MSTACTPAQTSAPDVIALVRDLAASHADQPGALLPLLHAVQHALGYIPPQAVATLAEALSLSRAEVHGVITFYPDFRSEPGGRHRLQICRAEACQAMGGEALAAHARSRLGCDFHGKSADGAYSLDPAYCLGLCAQSPALMLDGRPYARMSVDGLDRLIDASRQA
ncbi:formate dehydrogenase subunit gamma [Bordetella holmesii]|uniref:NAD-dependent formate dehydrogenase, gamma subunit n=2 Tax=Bordetella holmesii TaxID=35814 RepID=A0A158M442_9BORD|nr:formate dehydrogenase subunit gamma [Bordetella holmesii]AHV92011.1 respiratory-chain NADH dehydrogenase 24 Kd subunit [Bordetella holmesii ATCC 51541]AIT27514.1 respiratory-chain NADH dehydrogenase 24 Kd subunit [Bordetella holmesii 44057]EWM43680.1 respiratory-chain NADH dehydrogenase 24 Kd subunit [Bordetella holmesii 41130]EWM48105.1 respiratory-chain NADH dehydrogenase 24 Kd subunit [Bordetella holmesii 35009]EWM49087.1 respiratory-chain NADH dehydrogenase 24 Kd subunit [Bordetella hol